MSALFSYLLKHLDIIIIGAIVVIALLIAYGRGVSDTNKTRDAEMATAQLAWANERTKAAEAALDNEKKLRAELEAKNVQLHEQELAHYEIVNKQNTRIVQLDSTRSQLLQHIANYAKAYGTAEVPTATCGDLQRRVETLGLLLGEADGMAEESDRAADRLGDLVRLCRSAGKVIGG